MLRLGPIDGESQHLAQSLFVLFVRIERQRT